MKKNLLYSVIMMVIVCQQSIAQNVSINNTASAPDPSAMLDITSSTKGLLIPRMTKNQRSLIVNPKNGLMVFDSSSASFWFYKKNQWQELASNTTTSDSALTYGQQTGSVANYNLNATTHNTVVSDSSGYIYDSGGPSGNYGNSEDYSVFIYSFIANVIGYKIQVISNSLENPLDTLFITSDGVYPRYDTLTGTETAQYTFDNSPVIVRFRSNASNTAAGFKIRWDVIFPPLGGSSVAPLSGWYYSPEKLAMHGGYNINNQWNNSYTGFASFNYGYGNIATGDYSTSLGSYTVASGKYAAASGYITNASGDNSFSMGDHTTASGIAAVSSGSYSIAQGDYSKASGFYSTATGYAANAWGTFAHATGYNSTAFGGFTTASANEAVAFGNQTTASGFNSTAFGNNATASGNSSISMGLSTVASGDYSMALGSRIGTNSMSGSFAIGDAGIYSTLVNDAQNQMLMRFEGGYKFHLTDATLAMAIDADGNMGIGTGTPLAGLHLTDKSVVFSATGNLPGSVAAPPIQTAGRRTMWYADKAAFRTGYVDGSQWNQGNIGNYSFASGTNTTASGSSSTAMGYNTVASNSATIAMGYNSTASGIFSTAIGQVATASGQASVALGFTTIGSGDYSTALGSNSIASGSNSISMGEFTTAKSGYETVIGRWNTNYTPLTPSGWNPADRLFTVANGTGSGATSNAITILKNGNTAIGADNPAERLDVNGRVILRANGGASAGIWFNNLTNSTTAFWGMTNDNVHIGSYSGGTFRFVINTNTGNVGIGNLTPTRPLSFPGGTLGEKILLYPGATGEVGIGVYSNELRLHCDNPGSKVSFGTQTNAGVFTELGNFQQSGAIAMNVFGSIWANGTVYASDARYKKNIMPISSALQKLVQIEGVEYEMNTSAFPKNNFTTGRQIGLLAQNVEKVVPEAVHENNGYKGVDYARLVPLLIESIKEQQKQIEDQQRQIDELKKLARQQGNK